MTKCGKDTSLGYPGAKYFQNFGTIRSFGVPKAIGMVKNSNSFNEQCKVTGTINRDFHPAKIECHILPTFAPL